MSSEVVTSDPTKSGVEMRRDLAAAPLIGGTSMELCEMSNDCY
jgi:hypothetical protein